MGPCFLALKSCYGVLIATTAAAVGRMLGGEEGERGREKYNTHVAT